MKKILILTSERTGTGHKSAANAIENKIDKQEYEVKQVDSFSMMGRIGIFLENLYIPVTTIIPLLYYIAFLITQIFPNFMHYLIYILSRKNLKKLINDYKPDLIISVHCMFTKSVSHLLQKEKLDIPFYINVIDLVKPPHVWIDKNADAIFVPTKEVKDDYILKGLDSEKIFISGFPIRDDILKRTTPKKIEDKINILVVNPSRNLNKCILYIKEISKINNASVTVVCGRDKNLYKTLTKLQNSGRLSNNIVINGFVNNMNELLDNAHIIFTKAGPNMILESARSATSIIITGHVLGQENYNYKFVEDNNFGFKCESPNRIYEELNEFIQSKKINKCLNNVLKVDCTDGASFIANFIKTNL